MDSRRELRTNALKTILSVPTQKGRVRFLLDTRGKEREPIVRQQAEYWCFKIPINR